MGAGGSGGKVRCGCSPAGRLGVGVVVPCYQYQLFSKGSTLVGHPGSPQRRLAWRLRVPSL